jgi:hypothetical protein
LQCFFRYTGVTPEELTQGFALLIFSFMHLWDGPMDLVAPVIRKFRALDLMPEEVLPTMAGGADGCRVGPVTVAVAPHHRRNHPDPRGWGGPAWAYTARLLADFLGFAADEQGATAKLTDSLFAKLEEDAGDERRSRSLRRIGKQ